MIRERLYCAKRGQTRDRPRGWRLINQIEESNPVSFAYVLLLETVYLIEFFMKLVILGRSGADTTKSELNVRSPSKHVLVLDVPLLYVSYEYHMASESE